MKVKASFVIPSKDCVHYLPAAVYSALAQDYPNIEVVIVDDGSTDGTPQYTDWIAKMDKRVIVVRNERSVGRSAARNQGIALSQGTHIFVLDADDLAEPKRVSLSMSRFKDTGCAYVYGGAILIDAVGAQIAALRAEVVKKEKALESLENGIVHSTAAYTRKFAEKYPYSEGEVAKLGIDDWEQQIRAILAGEKFEAIPAHIGCYRLTRAGISIARDPEAVKAFKRAFVDGVPAK